VIGDYLYSSEKREGPYRCLTDEPVTNLKFIIKKSGKPVFYMVRAVGLEITPSGSYYNLSQGSFSENP